MEIGPLDAYFVTIPENEPEYRPNNPVARALIAEAEAEKESTGKFRRFICMGISAVAGVLGYSSYKANRVDGSSSHSI